HCPLNVTTANSADTSCPAVLSRSRHWKRSPMGAMIDSTSSWRASSTAPGGACSNWVYRVMGANVATRVSLQPGITPASRQNQMNFNEKTSYCYIKGPPRCRSVTSSGCSLTSLFAVWQVKQIGNAAASVPNNLSAGIWFHSTLTWSATSSAGWLPVQSISPIGCPHAAQSLSRYHLAMMLRTRHSAPAARTSLRHCCPHPAFSGQRVHSLSRNWGALPSALAAACVASTTTPACALAAACVASTTTPAGRWVSGHVTIRCPRYFHQAPPSRHTPSPAKRITARANNDIGIRNSKDVLARRTPLHGTAKTDRTHWI